MDLQCRSLLTFPNYSLEQFHTLTFSASIQHCSTVHILELGIHPLGAECIKHKRNHFWSHKGQFMGENRGKKHSTALLYLPGRWGPSRCLVRKGIKEYFNISFRKLCVVCLSNSIEKWFCGTGDSHRTCKPGCNHYLGIPQTRRKREPRLVSKKHKIRNMGVYNLIRRESQW